VPNAQSCSLAARSRARVVLGDGGAISVRCLRGSVALTAGLAAIHSQRTACRSLRRRIEWICRILAGARPAWRASAW
jgi:hypothetical protein